MSPHETYVSRSLSDMWTLIAYALLSRSSSDAATLLVDLPSTTFWRGYSGCGFRFAHEPAWMCAGCGSEVPFETSISTVVWSPSAVNVAVPDSPEPLCSDSSTVTLPSPAADPSSESSPPQPAATSTTTASSMIAFRT